MIIDTLAELHAIEPREAGLVGLGKPEGFVQRQVVGWAERMRVAEFELVQMVDELERRLLSRLPRSDKVTLLHNDWRLDNLALP